MDAGYRWLHLPSLLRSPVITSGTSTVSGQSHRQNMRLTEKRVNVRN